VKLTRKISIPIIVAVIATASIVFISNNQLEKYVSEVNSFEISWPSTGWELNEKVPENPKFLRTLSLEPSIESIALQRGVNEWVIVAVYNDNEPLENLSNYIERELEWVKESGFQGEFQYPDPELVGNDVTLEWRYNEPKGETTAYVIKYNEKIFLVLATIHSLELASEITQNEVFQVFNSFILLE